MYFFFTPGDIFIEKLYQLFHPCNINFAGEYDNCIGSFIGNKIDFWFCRTFFRYFLWLKNISQNGGQLCCIRILKRDYGNFLADARNVNDSYYFEKPADIGQYIRDNQRIRRLI